jgi:hypothetical protein
MPRGDIIIVTTETYRFAVPHSDDGVVIRRLQEYFLVEAPPGIYQLEVPGGLQDLISDRHECGNWIEIVQTLARAFCQADVRLAASLINR